MPPPIAKTVVTIPSEISATMTAYSIAVAPRRSTRKRPRLRAVAVSGNPKEVIALSFVLCFVRFLRSPSQQRRQVRDQRHVGRRHRILLEPVGLSPSDASALPGR